MGKCIHHPDRETPYICMKHQDYLCKKCLQCRDPKIYCKHRSACPIWFMGKRQERWDAEKRLEKEKGDRQQGHGQPLKTEIPVKISKFLEQSADAGSYSGNTHAFEVTSNNCLRNGKGAALSFTTDAQVVDSMVGGRRNTSTE